MYTTEAQQQHQRNSHKIQPGESSQAQHNAVSWLSDRSGLHGQRPSHPHTPLPKPGARRKGRRVVGGGKVHVSAATVPSRGGCVVSIIQGSVEEEVVLYKYKARDHPSRRGGGGEGEGVATQQKRGGGREGGAGEREEAMGVPADVEVTPTAAAWSIRIRQEVGRHARLDPSQSTSTGPYKLRRKQCRARPQPSQRVDVVALRWNTAWMV